MRRIHPWQGLALLAALAVGCASMPVPAKQKESTEAAIRAAQEVGATSDPKAELHLKLAQDQAKKAQDLIDQAENERAAFMLKRAETDAELALALARQAEVRSDAQQALDRVRALQQNHKTE